MLSIVGNREAKSTYACIHIVMRAFVNVKMYSFFGRLSNLSGVEKVECLGFEDVRIKIQITLNHELRSILK